MTLIRNCLSDEVDIAARSRNSALVDHALQAIALEEQLLALHEILVENIERRADKACAVDMSIGTDEHAIGIDQVDLAIGLELAEKSAHLFAHDAVQNS